MDIEKRIATEIGAEAALGQLAEECAELAKAALKAQRILHGTNPTPVTREQALADMQEEATDVVDCLDIIREIFPEVSYDECQSEAKMDRWVGRIDAHKNGKEITK